MRTSLIIILNRLFTFGCKLIKIIASILPRRILNKFPILERDATVLPGRLVLPLDRNVLTKIKYPKYVIGVTGSSGKGTTTALIAHVLKENGLEVVWNKEGSNIVNGTATLILNNTKIFSHQMRADVLLLEMDEAFIKATFKKPTLTHLVVTNVTRDQPARNATPEIIFNKIKDALDNNIHLIINADDVLVNRFSFIHDGELTTYGIAKTKYSLDKPLSPCLDGVYCFICHQKLNYQYYHYGHFGKFNCPGCDFARNVDYEADNVDLEKGTIEINGHLIKLNKNAFFNVYSTVAAYALCKEIGISDVGLDNAFNINVLASKRLKSLKLDNREVHMLESKNENNLSYFQSLEYINNYPNAKTIILGFDNVSRRYKYNDISWLYDIDFQHLNNTNVDYIYCIGRFRYDVAARLVNAGISKEKLILVDDLPNIKTKLQESTGTIFTMVCFDMTAILEKVFIEGDNNEN